MAVQQKLGVEAVQLPAPPQQISESSITAVGATDVDGVFIVHFSGVGFRYLDAKSNRQKAKECWAVAGNFTGSSQGDFGLFFRRVDDSNEGDEARCVFVEDPQTLSYYRMAALPPTLEAVDVPKGNQSSAQLIRQESLPGNIVAAAAAKPSDCHMAAVAVVLANGFMRCYDPSACSGAGKGLTLNSLSGSKPSSTASLACMGSGRYVLVRGGGSSAAEYFVVGFNLDSRRLEQQHSGSMEAPSALGLQGQLRLHSIFTVPAPNMQVGDDSLLLCWAESGSKGALGFATASALNTERPVLRALPKARTAGTTSSGRVVCASVVNGYVVELAASATQPQLIVRDTRFGMTVTTGALPEDAQGLCTGKGTPLASTSGGFGLYVKGGSFAVVRWLLPEFSLHMIIGSAQVATPNSNTGASDAQLRPLEEMIRGKRERNDDAVAELFSAKRRATTEKLLVQELRNRQWHATHELVDAVVDHKSWPIARALLALPELTEESAVRLLTARPELLPKVVRRSRDNHVLAAALRDHLPAAQLQSVVEVLVTWLDSYKEFTEDELKKAVPDLPTPEETMDFLSALADGCLPSLAQLDPKIVEKVIDTLRVTQSIQLRTERLYGAVRAAMRPKRPLVPASIAPTVEVCLFPL